MASTAETIQDYVANYELPDYADVTGVPTVTYGSGRTQDEYGTTYLDRWEMNDEHGTGYKVLRCMAANPRSDVWVLKDTAWSTQVHGLNTDIARQLMKIGFNVLIKGPEEGSSLPLSQSSYNTHVLASAYEDLGDLDASLVAFEGYSRGAMLAFGSNAYARRFGREALLSNLTDPCVGRKIKLNPPDEETLKKAVTLPVDLGLLGVAVLKGLSANPVRGMHLAKTIDVSPRGAVQFVRTGAPLMTGESGMMAAHTPLDMKATIAFFRRCRVNDADLYEAIFADRPNVRIVRPEGGHGGGIDRRIIGNMAVRFGRLADQLEEQRRPEEIDYSKILRSTPVAA